ncbi:MAG: hypothetical protein EBU90_20450 [Proteobacteria bacterium]|nr:hypothetical protein [Pseudomonadota bacterium]
MNRRDIQLIQEARKRVLGPRQARLPVAPKQITPTKDMTTVGLIISNIHNQMVVEVDYGEAPWGEDIPLDYTFVPPSPTYKPVFNDWSFRDIKTFFDYMQSTSMSLDAIHQHIHKYVKGVFGNNPKITGKILRVVDTFLLPYKGVQGTWIFDPSEIIGPGFIDLTLLGAVDKHRGKAQKELEQHIGVEDVLGIKDIFNEL